MVFMPLGKVVFTNITCIRCATIKQFLISQNRCITNGLCGPAVLGQEANGTHCIGEAPPPIPTLQWLPRYAVDCRSAFLVLPFGATILVASYSKPQKIYSAAGLPSEA